MVVVNTVYGCYRFSRVADIVFGCDRYCLAVGDIVVADMVSGQDGLTTRRYHLRLTDTICQIPQ